MLKKKSSHTQRILITCIFLFTCTWVSAQLFAPKQYPQKYFQWPVGAKIGLVANFGELRPNHYHMGLDMRTDQKQNVPVYAAAAGYIAKVKIEPYGFGRCIYINHPNGLTTLYAHLNDFYPALEKYITEQQYRLEQWKVFLDIPENLFPVKKGDFIAYSGSTGGSQGPHVHFEIRDTKSDKVLNPLLFDFPIADNIAPDIVRLAVYDRNLSTYEQTPVLYALKKVNGVYRPAGGNIRVKSDKVSFAITAFDRYTGSTNQNGIYKAELFDNDKTIAGFEMDSISYDETRYLNAHIDYKTRSSGGPWLEHLSKLPGHQNGIYQTAPGQDGVIRLADEAVHDIRIVVSDANENRSTLQFSLQREAEVVRKQIESPVKMFLPGYVNVFENPDLSFYLPEGSLYDSFHIQFTKTIPVTGRPIYQVHNNQVPVQNYFPVKIRDDFPMADTGRIIMKRSWKTKEDYKKTTYENGWYKASFREFGQYQLILDSIPPQVTPVGFKDGMMASRINRIVFVVKDNTEEIKSFTALLDGKWLRFSNDKGKTFIYAFDEHCGPGQHELLITVIDLAGNKTEKRYGFVR